MNELKSLRFKGYLNKVDRKLIVGWWRSSLWLKGYLNEVGKKPNNHYYQLKGYLNKVGKKLKPIDLHDLKGI